MRAAMSPRDAGARSRYGPPMLRIGFDGRYLNGRYHGIGRVAHSLLEAMVARSSDIQWTVFMTSGDQDPRFSMAALTATGRVRVARIPIPVLSPVDQMVWPFLARRYRLDLFHSPYTVGPLAAGVPVITTVHDLILERFPDYAPGPWIRAAYRSMASLSVRRASAIIAVSQATRQDLERLYPAARGKTEVIHNGVADSFMREALDMREQPRVRARYGLPLRYVLAVGAGRPHKGTDVVIEALARMGPEAPAIVIVGAPDPRFPDTVGQAVEALAMSDRVLRLAHVEETDLPFVYAMARALIFPSHVEGFGLPILEAMAAATPVITTDASVMPEIAGDAALYFPPGDATALSEAIRSVEQGGSLRQTLIDAGRSRAASFSWTHAADAVIRLYRRLA